MPEKMITLCLKIQITGAGMALTGTPAERHHKGIYMYDIEAEDWTKLPGEIPNDRIGSAVLVNRDLFPKCDD